MITFNKVNIGYKQVLIKDVNIQLIPGEFLLLCGRNGAGKSTLLETIIGNLSPISGTINTDSDLPLSSISSICYPSINTYGNTTFLDIVAQGRMRFTNYFDRCKPEDILIINKAMEALGILEFSHKLLKEVSDGERQKALIARALASEASIILLDEPTAFLDYPSKVKLLRLLANLAQTEQKLIIMSSHDIDLAQKQVHGTLLIDNKHLIRNEAPNFKEAFERFLEGKP